MPVADELGRIPTRAYIVMPICVVPGATMYGPDESNTNRTSQTWAVAGAWPSTGVANAKQPPAIDGIDKHIAHGETSLVTS